MRHENPFALVRASDYTDKQINSLWVEIGSPAMIDTIIEPKSNESKFILGGKGTGKTHLLRYYSYPAVKLRFPNESGLNITKKQKFLAIFLRATSLDSSRFEFTNEPAAKWQQLFGIYLELKLAEGVLDALCDIKETSAEANFDDKSFLKEVKETILSPEIASHKSIDDFRNWVIKERRGIDFAVNNAAFTGKLDVKASFAIGALCLPIGKAMRCWNSTLSDLPLIYLIDEIENFSLLQQQVVNTLIRYTEGLASFRVTGRRYAIRTNQTLADGEENRDGNEFKITYLDDLLREQTASLDFSKKFIIRRLQSAGHPLPPNNNSKTEFDPANCFEEINTSDCYRLGFAQAKISPDMESFQSNLFNTIKRTYQTAEDEAIYRIVQNLTNDLPPILQKLNSLRLFKKTTKKTNPETLSEQIRRESINFLNADTKPKNSYATAYGHYASDLFAQICRESKSRNGIPYAGFETFVKMASGNPRSLLLILGKAYEISSFKGIDFISDSKLSILMQTEAVQESSKFMYESDTNFGQDSDIAREATARLATLLRTARYAFNIPEVSPLAFSFANEDLTPEAKRVLHCALNYSLIFELADGRPDRNSQKVHRKIQLNPLLSPKWGLPISVRGDIRLNKDMLKCIFQLGNAKEFNTLLSSLSSKWNTLTKGAAIGTQQELF